MEDVEAKLKMYLTVMSKEKFFFSIDGPAIATFKKACGCPNLNIADPPDSKKELLLNATVDPASMGDEFFNKAIADAAGYGFRPELVQSVLSAFFSTMWNKADPLVLLRAGDAVVAANGARCATSMLERLRDDKVLELTLRSELSYKCLVADIERLVEQKRCGPLLMRLSFHDSAVYSTGKLAGGRSNAAMRLVDAGEAAFPANAGLPEMSPELLRMPPGLPDEKMEKGRKSIPRSAPAKRRGGSNALRTAWYQHKRVPQVKQVPWRTAWCPVWKILSSKRGTSPRLQHYPYRKL